MAGFPVLGPIEHSVLEITLDGGHSEMTIDEEPLAHSFLDVTLEVVTRIEFWCNGWDEWIEKLFFVRWMWNNKRTMCGWMPIVRN